MSITKTAGKFVVSNTAPWPITHEIGWLGRQHLGEKIRFTGLSLEDMKDLRYCLDATIADTEATLAKK